MIQKFATLLAVGCALSGCVTAPVRDFSALQAAAPRSILVVPVVNKSLDVDAPNYVLATLPTPIAEKGYYTFPVNTARFVLEQEGLYEPERVHSQSAAELARLFGADSVLYVTIDRWDAQYALITTTVTVAFRYRLVGKDGQELWSEEKKMVYSPQNNSGGHPLAQLIAAAITAAMTRAAPNYIPLAQQAHMQVFHMGAVPFPDGPYRAPAK